MGGEQRGYELGGKKVKGRKRHLLVDTEGLVLKAKIHSAKIMDYEGIKTLLGHAAVAFPPLSHLWLDAGYRGEDKGKDLVEKTLLGWSVLISSSVRESPLPKKSPEVVGQAVAQGRCECGLGEAVGAARVRSIAEEVVG